MNEKQDVSVGGDKKYSEQVQDFKVKRFSKGVELSSENLFNEGSSTLNENSKKWLENFTTFLRINRNVELELRITASDTYTFVNEKPKEPSVQASPETKQKNKKDKKNAAKDNSMEIYNQQLNKYNLEKSKAEDQADILIQKRAVELNNFLSKFTFKNRLSITSDKKLMPSTKENETNIIVSKCENKLK